MFDVELQVILLDYSCIVFARRIVRCLVKLRAARCLI